MGLLIFFPSSSIYDETLWPIFLFEVLLKNKFSLKYAYFFFVSLRTDGWLFNLFIYLKKYSFNNK